MFSRILSLHTFVNQRSVKILLLCLLTAWLGMAGVLTKPQQAEAAGVVGWDAGNIIDDSIFTNYKTLTAPQIQSFLNGKVPSCDTNGTKPATEFGRSDLTHAQYAKLKGWHQPPYTCLKDYKKNGKTAADLIYATAQKYRINPQVFLVLLQKEQSLVRDTWPLDGQYRTATGYGCPDTKPCDKEYFGLENQLDWAGKMYRAIMDNSPTWYTPYVLGKNYIQYHPNKSCGGSNVVIKNRATQALYNYTPYQPNKATLKAGYGTAECGAYGNRNFYLYFNDWFGSTRDKVESAVANRYYQLSQAMQTNLGEKSGDYTCKIKNTYCWQEYEGGFITWNKFTGAWESLGPIRDRWNAMGAEHSSLKYPTGSLICTARNDGCFQKFQNGYIIGTPDTGYWESKGGIRIRWAEMGFQNSSLGYPIGPEEKLNDGGWQQAYENGVIVGHFKTGYWESKGSIRRYWVEKGSVEGRLGYPTGPEVLVSRKIYRQDYQGGYITGSSVTGYWSLVGSIGKTYTKLGEHNSDLGLPVSNEAPRAAGGWEQEFEHGFLSGDKGTYFSSSGPIRSYWIETGGAGGKMGKITEPTKTGSRDAAWQRFENGYIIWNPDSSHAWESKGSIRPQWAKLGYQSGLLGFPTGPEKRDEDGVWSQPYENGIIFSDRGRTWYTLN